MVNFRPEEGNDCVQFVRAGSSECLVRAGSSECLHVWVQDRRSVSCERDRRSVSCERDRRSASRDSRIVGVCRESRIVGVFSSIQSPAVAAQEPAESPARIQIQTNNAQTQQRKYVLQHVWEQDRRSVSRERSVLWFVLQHVWEQNRRVECLTS